MAVERYHEVLHRSAGDPGRNRRQIVARDQQRRSDLSSGGYSEFHWRILQHNDPRSGQPTSTLPCSRPEDLGTLGTSRRRFFSGPGLNNWDIALLKDTFITESVNLQFRAEAFNAFNHAQFQLPDGNINSSSFGFVTNANPPRIMQLSLKLLF